MTILERVETDRIQARKDGNAPLASFLGFLIAEGRKVGKDAKPPRESTDEEVIGIVRKTIASNEENLRLTEGADTNAVWQNKVLNAYLPTQLSEEDVEKLVREFMTRQNWSDEPISAKDMGPIMSMLKDCYPGQYNPKRASEIARKVIKELMEG
jgi:uncharacterized protein YqeY